jgi:hypothetical protein
VPPSSWCWVPAPALRELEALFWRHLGFAPTAPEDRAADPALLDAVCDTPPLAARDRLGIYAGMYVARLVEALEEDFPRVAAVLGAEPFAALARRYLARYPSEHPSIRHVGRAFADFAAANPADASPPWLGDLARLEWTRLAVFDAPDAPALSLADLRAVPPEAWGDLRFRPVPAFAFLRLDWPAHRAWAAEPGEMPALAPEATALRLWRDGFVVFHAPLDPREDAALSALLAGEPFAAICERFADLPPEEAAARAGALLVAWVEDGILAADLRGLGPRGD